MWNVAETWPIMHSPMPHTCHYQKYARLASLRVLTTFIVHTSVAWTCVLELIGLEILFSSIVLARARNNLIIECFIDVLSLIIFLLISENLKRVITLFLITSFLTLWFFLLTHTCVMCDIRTVSLSIVSTSIWYILCILCIFLKIFYINVM